MCHANPACVHYWQCRPLIYGHHALDRAAERDIPILRFLPPNARLADVDMKDQYLDSLLWKVTTPGYPQGYFMVISPTGYVITAWHKNDSQQKWEQSKNYRRMSEARAVRVSDMPADSHAALGLMHENLRACIKPSCWHKSRRSKSTNYKDKKERRT